MRFKLPIVILLLSVAALCGLNAQKIMLEGGYFNPKRLGKATSETYFDAVRIGASTDFDLKYNFAVQTGLYYNIGYSKKVQGYESVFDSIIYRSWSHAVEVPLRLVYNQPLFKDFKIFGFLGPNFQIGLIQNQKTISYLDDPAVYPHIISGKSSMYKPDNNRIGLKSGLHRINFQLGAGGGVQWRQFMLKGGYDWGINNLDKSKVDYVRQGNWYVSFGYQFSLQVPQNK